MLTLYILQALEFIIVDVALRGTLYYPNRFQIRLRDHERQILYLIFFSVELSKICVRGNFFEF